MFSSVLHYVCLLSTKLPVIFAQLHMHMYIHMHVYPMLAELGCSKTFQTFAAIVHVHVCQSLTWIQTTGVATWSTASASS